MKISQIEGTDLFLGPATAPRQVVRVTLAAGPASPPIRVRVEGPTVRTPEPAVTTALAAGEQRVVEVGVLVAAPATEGSAHQITVIADTEAGPVTADGRLRAAATGWTMWMISHFHYDPVWWNTQRGFTELWQQLPDVPGADRLRPPFVRTAFDLVRAHLDAARQDDDYRFVLAEVDYLKPYWDVFVEDRADLRRMLREGRVELVGGMYNEPNTNLTHPESTIRNAVHGFGYQRDVLGGDPRTAWMLDVFGHDPAFPGLMADAGLDLERLGARPVPPGRRQAAHRRHHPHAVPQRVRVGLTDRPRAAHRLHGQPLRGGLGHRAQGRPSTRPWPRRTRSTASCARWPPPATCCCRSGTTTTSRPAGARRSTASGRSATCGRGSSWGCRGTSSPRCAGSCRRRQRRRRRPAT